MSKSSERFYTRYTRVIGKSRGLADPTKADVIVIANNHSQKRRAGMIFRCISPDAVPLMEGVEKDAPANNAAEKFGIANTDALGWDNIESQLLAARIPLSDPQALIDKLMQVEPIRQQSLLDEINIARVRFPDRRIAVFIGRGHLTKGTKLLNTLKKKEYKVIVLEAGMQKRKKWNR